MYYDKKRFKAGAVAFQVTGFSAFRGFAARKKKVWNAEAFFGGFRGKHKTERSAKRPNGGALQRGGEASAGR